MNADLGYDAQIDHSCCHSCEILVQSKVVKLGSGTAHSILAGRWASTCCQLQLLSSPLWCMLRHQLLLLQWGLVQLRCCTAAGTKTCIMGSSK